MTFPRPFYRWRPHPWHGLEVGPKPPSLVHAFIEITPFDLSKYEITSSYDAAVCIGLLMFFDCPTAYRQLKTMQDHVRPGGVAIVNVLTEGTTYMDMFSAEGHCLFKQDELRAHFSNWKILRYEIKAFDAPANTRKVFATVIARKPDETNTDA